MPLSRRDIIRIEKLGYKLNEFAVNIDGKYILKNINGHCYFLDERDMKCKIYEYRPIGCRIYPVVYVEGGYIGVDDECPSANTVTKREIYRKKACLIMLVMEVEGIRRR